jgi:hypothetical protein
VGFLCGGWAGGELKVLQAIDFTSITIDVIVVEADGTNPEKDSSVIAMLQKQGFRYDGHDRTNDWFVRDGFIPSTPASQPEVSSP